MKSLDLTCQTGALAKLLCQFSPEMEFPECFGVKKHSAAEIFTYGLIDWEQLYLPTKLQSQLKWIYHLLFQQWTKIVWASSVIRNWLWAQFRDSRLSAFYILSQNSNPIHFINAEKIMTIFSYKFYLIPNITLDFKRRLLQFLCDIFVTVVR